MKWLLFVLSFFSMNYLGAQVGPRLEWAKGFGKSSPTGGDVGVVSIKFDSFGNRYVAGSFAGQADIDPGPSRSTLQSRGEGDFFLAKYDVSGNLLWVKGIGSTGVDFLNSMTVDAAGNIVVTGFFSNSVDFDPGAGVTSLTSAGDIDIFFAKYDTNGNLLWVKQLGGTGEDNAFSVGLDNAGNIYLTGLYSGMADFDPGSDTANLVSSPSLSSIFIAKYNTSGAYVWAKGISTSGSIGGGGVSLALDVANNIYVTGNFDGTADFDAGLGTSNLASGSAGNNIFLLKYDSTGAYIWANSISGTGEYDFANGLALDASGNVVLTGSFSGTADFDPGAGTSTFSAYDDYTSTSFIAKYSTSGTYMWSKSLPGYDAGSPSYPRSVKLDNLGNVYITGAFNGTIDFDPSPGTTNKTVMASVWAGYFAKYSNAGNLSWVNVIDGYNSSGVSAYAAELDASGKLWVGGYFKGDPDFEPDVDSVFLSHEIGPDIQHGFVASYDANGDYQSADILGSYGDGASVYVISTARDAVGNLYMTGRFEGSIDFDPGADTTLLTALNSENIFLTKYSASGNFLWAKGITGTGIASGTSIAIDPTGHIVLTGYFVDSIDFDPGAGSSVLHSSGLEDIFMSKYDADGNYLWAKSIGGTEMDKSFSMVLDGTGNILLTGNFGGTADFDPGANLSTRTSGSGAYFNTFLAKYDNSGNYIWANAFTSTSSNDLGRTLAVDASGNVYVSGQFWQTTDFDPGLSTYNLTATGVGSDLFLAKYNASGNFTWAFNVSSGMDIAGLSVQADTSGHVVVAGTFSGTADFDPGPGTANLSDLSGFTPSGFLAKYDAAGNYIWSKSILGDNPLQISGIKLDGLGNVFCAGHFNGTADFDPGSGATTYTSAGADDLFLAKYDSAGNYIWSQQLGGIGDDLFANPIDNILLLDGIGNIFVTGQFQETVDFDPAAGTTSLNAGSNQYFAFIAKYVDSTVTIVAPNVPTGLSASAAYNSAHISFTAPTNNGGGTITNYEYSINDSSWVALSPASTDTMLTIPGLTACNTYAIKIRAVNVAGGGTASDSVLVTPQGGEPAGINWVAHAAAENNYWNSVVYGNGVFVAVASDGTNRVMTSPDGNTWTARSASVQSWWQSVTYGNGKFVAVSNTDTNRVMTSSDGINWTGQMAAADVSWSSVTYGNGLFVALASSGYDRIMTSPDGINWTIRTGAALNNWRSVTYGNGLFVAVSLDGTNRVMTSPDGINWTARSASEASGWRSVTYGNGKFVAVAGSGTNRVMTSSDGINWTSHAAPEANVWGSVTYGNGMFVAISYSGTNRIMASPDGMNWTAHAAPEASSWLSVTYGQGSFVAVAGAGTNRVMKSSDLLAPGRPVISSITPADTTASVVFTAPTIGGSSSITNYEYSVDNGSNWVTPSPATTTSPLSIMGLTGGTSYAIKLRAVNTQGAGCASAADSITTVVPANAPTGLSATAGYNAAHITFTAPTNDGGATITNYEYSINDSSWLALSPAQTDGALTIPGLTACNTYTIKIRAVNVAGGGTASDSVVVTPQGGESAGINWVARAAASAKAWFSVTYGKGQFVALADERNNMVMTSPDGITWSSQTASADYGWTSITYGNGMYVAVASSGTNRVLTSPDGVTWTLRGAAEQNNWNSVTYGNGLFVAVASTGTNRVMTSPDGITWTARAASATSSWYSVTYGNGLFVAVAHTGTDRVMTSPDGINWTSRTAAAANFWRYVTYGNGLFVAVSSDGTNRVMTSPDGITWTARSASQALAWMSVTYGNGMYVAVASQTNQVMTSLDAINWTSRTVPESNRWSTIIYGNGKFVALSYTGTNRVMTSSDLLAPGSPVISSITPADTTASVVFTAPTNGGSSSITNYEYSVDNGSNWVTPSPATTTSPLSITGLTGGTSYAIKLRAVNTQGAGCASAVDSITTVVPSNAPTGLSATAGYNAAHITFTAPTNDGGGTITNYEYSINDSSWLALSPAQTDGALTIPGLTPCNTYSIRIRAVNVAGGGTASDSVVVTPQGGESAGINWVARTAPVSKYWFSVAYGKGQFVALSDDYVNMFMTSPDGITWTGQTTPAVDYGWSSITYGNGMFVAVSTWDNVMTSPDGITWTHRLGAEQNIWNSVTYGNGLFVAVASTGTNRVMTSPDGITWTPRAASATSSWYSVTYGNGLFVAVAHTGTDRVMTSSDGINWTSRTAAEANFWRYVTYGNGLFVAVSSDGTNRVMTSPDGITWTARSASQALAWMSVAYGNGMYVAVASQTNQVMTSLDAINWTSRTVPESNRWTSIVYGNGKFVALSYTGTNRVMTSSDLLAPGSPVISSITPADTTASVVFTAPANGGSSSITNYEYSVDNGSNWVTPSPATTTSPLSITGLTGGTSYAVKLRAVNTQGSGCASSVDSITTTIICINPTNGGTIASAQNGASPFNPVAFTSTTAASGETGTLEYKWQSSTTDSSSGFSDIASSNSATYDPGALTQTTWFRRLARVSCKADWTGAVQSNVLEVTVSKSWIGGNGNWNVGANWSDGLIPVYSDRLIIARGNPQLNVDYEIGGNLTISGSGSLTVNAGKTLTVSGTADFGGKSVVFRSNASATAQLGVVSGTLINDGNVTVERFIPNTGRRWRLLTAPVDGISINQAWQNGQTWNGTAALSGDTTGTLITGKQQGNAVAANNRGFDFWSAISNSSSSIQTYNQRAGQGTWVDQGNTQSANAFNSNQGYLLFIRGPRSSAYSTGSSNASTTLRPTGKLRQGTITIRVDGSKGYTLVGNPYASQIDFDSIYSNSGNSALIKRQIWVWDATRGVSGDFQAVMYSAGKYIEVPAKFHASGQASPLTAIQSGQAFMVVPQSASSGNITIRESNKIMAMPTTPNLLLATDKTPRVYMNLMRRELTGEIMLSDGIMVAYGSGYRMQTTDEDDMQKFNNLGDNMVVMNNGTSLIADARSLTDIGTPIDLNMWNLSGSAYRFDVKMEGMPATEWEAYLEDQELKTRSPLSMQGDITSVDWQIPSTGSTSIAERFRIVFERKALRATSTPESMEEARSIRVYPNPVTGREFTVSLSQQPADVYTLQLFGIDGRMVMNKRINHESGSSQYKLDLDASLPKGTYQLRCLRGQEPVSITKMLIQ